MEKPEALKFLRHAGWLSTTPEAFQDSVLARCDLLTLKPGQTLYFAGDEPGGLFGVVTGRLELHFALQGTDPTLAYVGGPGFWTGEAAAVAGRPRRLTIIAGANCRLLRLPRAEMVRIAEADPLSWQYLAQLQARAMFLCLDTIDALRRRDPVERVAAVLCNLQLGLPEAARTLTVSQTDIGSMTQLARSTVNAVLGDLERRGMIRCGYARIDIPDLLALSTLAWGG